MSLTDEQRKKYARSLAAGVPEAAIAEFEKDLDDYIDGFKKTITTALKKKGEGK